MEQHMEMLEQLLQQTIERKGVEAEFMARV
jgi:hypothetical protein